MAHKRIFETRKINTSVHCFLFSTKMAVCLSFRCICVVYTVPCEKAGLQYTVLLLSMSHCALIGHNFPRANVSFAVRRSYTRSSRNSNNYSIFICYIQIRRSVFKYYTSKKCSIWLLNTGSIFLILFGLLQLFTSCEFWEFLGCCFKKKYFCLSFFRYFSQILLTFLLFWSHLYLRLALFGCTLFCYLSDTFHP